MLISHENTGSRAALAGGLGALAAVARPRSVRAQVIDCPPPLQAVGLCRARDSFVTTDEIQLGETTWRVMGTSSGLPSRIARPEALASLAVGLTGVNLRLIPYVDDPAGPNLRIGSPKEMGAGSFAYAGGLVADESADSVDSQFSREFNGVRLPAPALSVLANLENRRVWLDVFAFLEGSEAQLYTSVYNDGLNRNSFPALIPPQLESLSRLYSRGVGAVALALSRQESAFTLLDDPAVINMGSDDSRPAIELNNPSPR